MNSLQLIVEEVENGYTIRDISGMGTDARGKMFVAVTKASLAQVITDLAHYYMKAEASQNGAVQEPKA